LLKPANGNATPGRSRNGETSGLRVPVDPPRLANPHWRADARTCTGEKRRFPRLEAREKRDREGDRLLLTHAVMDNMLR